jgi:hypothetical protein
VLRVLCKTHEAVEALLLFPQQPHSFWPTCVFCVTGPRGHKGDKGDKGDQGDKGADGEFWDTF